MSQKELHLIYPGTLAFLEIDDQSWRNLEV